MPKQIEYKTLIGKRKIVCCTWKSFKKAKRDSVHCKVPLYRVETIVNTKRV